MRRTIIAITLLSTASAIFLSGCASVTQQDQLKFGIQAAQRDLWDEAIFRWKKVVQVNPNSASAHNNLAVAYEKKGLWREAEEEYEIAIRLNPDNKYIQSNFKSFQRNRDQKEKDAKETTDEKKK